MSNIVIQAENISKVYQLGQIGSGTISGDLEQWWSRIRGREQTYPNITKQQRSNKGTDFLWSLKDISFEIEAGRTVGIIGRNGAGKSTLLKVLSRITTPTKGSIRLKGRVASLLEIGTGFHPELTGRENIFLNGAILGMRKAEIRKNFDAIVDFAEVERYIDTPVKRYSSGMYVRLAFAVAAHLQSEILIVDEVLAVGDAAFQKKCLGEMGRLSNTEGRTILFVSHNIAAIKALCTHGIYLKDGQIAKDSVIDDAIAAYSQSAEQDEIPRNSYQLTEQHTSECRFRSITILPNDNNNSFDLNRCIKIEIELVHPVTDIVVSLQVLNQVDMVILHSSSEFDRQAGFAATGKISCTIPAYLLNEGTYRFNFTLAVRNKVYLDQQGLLISITDGSFSQPLTASTDWHGLSSPKVLSWD